MDKSPATSWFRQNRFTPVLARLLGVVSRSTLPLCLRSRWIPGVVGGVLLIAAALKAQQLFSDVESGAFQSRWFQVLLVEAELACGLALWLALRQRFTRWAAMLLFAAFFGVALSQALDGVPSCACFGAVQFHPWLAVSLDAAMLGAISCWKHPASEPTPVINFQRRCACAVPLAALLGFPVTLFALTGADNYPHLQVSPAVVALGTVEQGGRRSFVLHLHNPNEAPVTVEEVETSCPCLGARGLPWVLAAGHDRKVELALDFARNADFVGRLSIRLRGLSPSHAPLFSSQLEIAVAPTARRANGVQ